MAWLVTPFTAAILNLIGAVLALVGLGISLEPEALKRRAMRAAKLSDFGPNDFEAPLALACRSFEDDAQLSFLGRILARELLVGALVSRLRWAALKAADEPALSTPLNRPIIVVGLPRSGTTLIHRLLSDLPGLRPLYTWELLEPVPLPPLPAARLKRMTRLRLSVLRRLAPELDIKHLLDADEPEEEVSLFDASFWTPTFWRFGLVRGYLRWYLAADPAPGYAVYADILRLLQAQTPQARFILKMPNHTGYIDALRAAVPGAIIIQTHRDPVPVVGSYASLMRSVHRVSAADWDPAVGGAESLALWRHHAERCRAVRTEMPPGAVLDVRFSEVVEDLEGVIRRILAHADITPPADLAERVAIHGRRSGPRHVYDLADYGLTEAAVRERFTAYTERFLK